MKNLEEKKLLVKMAKAFGQPVDPALLESIEREERLSKILFKEEALPSTTIVKEEPVIEVTQSEPESPPPPPAFEIPSKETVVQQTINVLTTQKSNTANNFFRDKELEGIRRTLAEMMQKISTLSWGGGGTGVVRIWDTDDFDRTSAQNGRYMKFQDGWFTLDEINPYEIVHNTTLVTTNTYSVVDTDYYIGVNYAGPVTITIPASISAGREIVIKDESGNCETHNITVSAKVDNDANGFILAVNNGAIHMLYRGDSWRII